MANLGFTSYDTQPDPVPTIQEILAALTGQQKGWILEAFVEKILPPDWRQWVKDNYPTEFAANPAVVQVPRVAIVRLYRAIDSIEERSRILMRGELLLTPAEVDPETGEVTTPAEYNTPPATATALKNAIATDFADEFTEAQVTAVLTKMVNYSKADGTGTWTYYKAEVVK